MDNGGDNAGPIGDQNDSEPLNISDVLHAITLADPTYGADASVVVEAEDDAMARPPHLDEPCVRIIEQPASKALRFRYECEGRSAGSIPGVNSTPENKTYPTIKICGYIGPAAIVVSCVTKEQPHRPHPHNLVGREGCKKGVCTIPIRVTEETCEYQFKNLGIQCVKRRDIGEALLLREQLRIDPFRTGFGHRNHPQSIDLNAVRLCFHVFTPDESGRMRRALPPVVSDVIFDKKAMSDLHIMRASHCSGTARGGTQVILLCEKVTREETAVVFYQQDNNQVVWEEPAIIMVVHKQVAIAFETPPYRNPHTGEHVNVHFQLKRLSDNARSNSLPFEYIPEFPDRIKRRKMVNSMLHQEHERLLLSEQKPIKSEPRDKASPHHVGGSPMHMYSPHSQYAEQNWGLEGMAAGAHAFADAGWPGAAYAAPHQLHVLQPLQPLQPPSPAAQPMSPASLPAVSPASMHAMSPGHLQVMSTDMQGISLGMQRMQAPSPGGMQLLQPGMAQAVGRLSPSMQGPQNLGHISPNVQQHMSPNVQQPDYLLMGQPMAMEQHSASLSNLLLDQAEGITLNSSELSSLSSMLG